MASEQGHTAGRRTAQKWINWAHELEAEAARLRDFGYAHVAQQVSKASVELGNAGRAALAKAQS